MVDKRSKLTTVRFAVAGGIVMVLTGCRPGPDDAQKAYKGPGPAKSGAPSADMGGAAPAKPTPPPTTGPQRAN